jgi:hypothetical protein
VAKIEIRTVDLSPKILFFYAAIPDRYDLPIGDQAKKVGELKIISWYVTTVTNYNSIP